MLEFDAYKINPFTKTVELIKLNADNLLEDLYKHIKTNMVDKISIIEGERTFDIIFCDEFGFNSDQIFYSFNYNNSGQDDIVLGGISIILKAENSDWCSVDEQFLDYKIQFFSKQQSENYQTVYF